MLSMCSDAQIFTKYRHFKHNRTFLKYISELKIYIAYIELQTKK